MYGWECCCRGNLRRKKWLGRPTRRKQRFIHMLIQADIAVAPILVMFPLLGLLWFGLVVALETLVFRWLQWGTMRRSLLDTLLVNIISTAVGVFLYGAFLAIAFQCTSTPVNNG